MKKLLILLLLALPCLAQNIAKGNITAAGSTCATTNACVTLTIPASSAGSCTVQISGTYNGTIQFEGSTDGTTWASALATPIGSTTSVTSTTSTGTWRLNAGGLAACRARASAFVSGTAVTVIGSGSGSASTGTGSVTVVSSGSLTSTAFVTGGGSQTLQTPSATSTLDASGNAVFAGSVNATSVSTGTAPAGIANTATGGFGCTEGTTTGWTPTAATDYVRCDSTLHEMVVSNNGGAERPSTTAYTLVSSGAIGALSIANGRSQIVICSATCSVTPLTPPAANYQLCVIMEAGVTGTITLNALGNSAKYGKTDGSAYGTAGTGTMVSASATGNRVCIVGSSATTYETVGSNGTFTNN